MIPVWARMGRKAPAGASYPLDGLDDDLWAAWAPYRLLSSFSSAYIRVRRSNDNAEADCASDAEIASHCGANNGFIVTLYDQTGNSRNATQTTAASQPKIYNGSAIITDIGGMPCADYDGTDDYLDTPSMSSSGLTTIEMFGAAKNDADPAASNGKAGCVFFTNSAGTGTHHPWTDGSIYDGTFRSARASGNPTDALTSTYVWGVLSVTSGNFTLWINAEQLHNAATGSFSLTHQSALTNPRIGMALAQSAPTTKYWYDGKIGAVLLYSADKSSDRTSIRSAIT